MSRRALAAAAGVAAFALAAVAARSAGPPPPGPETSAAGPPAVERAAAEPSAAAAPGSSEARARSASIVEVTQAGEAARILDRTAESARLSREPKAATEGAEDAQREAAAALRTELIEALRREPDLAIAVLAELDRSGDEAALELARVLRFVKSGALVDALRERLESARPIERRAAIIALEGRDAAVWLAPVGRAYLRDTDPAVRDQAAAVLGRALADRKFQDVRGSVRETLAEGLGDAEPAARIRAARALLHSVGSGSEDAELVRPLLEDPDPAVRAEAGAIVRAFERAAARAR